MAIFNVLTNLAGLQVVEDVVAHLGPIVMCSELVYHLVETEMAAQRVIMVE